MRMYSILTLLVLCLAALLSPVVAFLAPSRSACVRPAFQRQHRSVAFVGAPLFQSDVTDEDTDVDEEASLDEDDEEEDEEEDVEMEEEALGSTDEDADADGADRKRFNRRRYTMFIGNLPFGTLGKSLRTAKACGRSESPLIHTILVFVRCRGRGCPRLVYRIWQGRIGQHSKEQGNWSTSWICLC